MKKTVYSIQICGQLLRNKGTPPLRVAVPREDGVLTLCAMNALMFYHLQAVNLVVNHKFKSN